MLLLVEQHEIVTSLRAKKTTWEIIVSGILHLICFEQNCLIKAVYSKQNVR